MAENGAKVLAADAIRFAKHYKIKLYSKHSFTTTEGTFITDETIVRDIVSVTSEKDLLFVSIKQEDSNSFIVYLMEHNILYREIWSSDGKTTTLFDTKNIHQYPLFIKDLTNFGFEFQENYGRVTMIGNQLYSNPSILINALHILKTESIPTFGHHLSHIKCSVIIEKEFVDKVVQLFHQKFIESV
jgi:aspartokinase